MVIVAAVDTTDRAADVLTEAVTLAERFEDEVHVIHVMSRSEAVQAEEESVSHDGGLSTRELQERASRPAHELIEGRSFPVEVTPIGRIGDPAAEIVSYADSHDARYVVVSPRRKSQTGKILFGSVAQSVLLEAECPVVSLVNAS